MITIYFVDDDYLILDELKNLIDYETLGYQIVGMSTNSIKAKEEIISLNPDVIITDIQMDLLDGINLTKALMKQCKDSYFVFLSGYDKFDYALEAIRLGATSFLRKPIKEKELVSCLIDIKNKMIEDFSNQVQISLGKDAHIMSEVFERSHLLSKAPYRIICLNGINYQPLLEELRKYSSSQIKIYGDDNLCLLIAFNFYFDVLVELKRHFDQIAIGISLEKPSGDYHDIAELIRKIRICSKQKFITGRAELTIYDEQKHCSLIDDINAINQVTVLEDMINNLKQKLLDNHIGVYLLQKIYQSILLAMVRLKIIEMDKEFHISVIDTYDSIDSLIKDLNAYFYKGSTEDDKELIINEVKKEIENSLDKKLSMAHIAEKYGYNISYFSQLFKKIVGISFLEYLISLKIDRAKYKICNTNEPLQSIALEVGYDDYYHFSKIFKKYTSYSPSEYRLANRKSIKK